MPVRRKVVATHGDSLRPSHPPSPRFGRRRFVVTDTLPIPAEKRFGQLTVLSIAPALADPKSSSNSSVTLALLTEPPASHPPLAVKTYWGCSGGDRA